MAPVLGVLLRSVMCIVRWSVLCIVYMISFVYFL